MSEHSHNMQPKDHRATWDQMQRKEIHLTRWGSLKSKSCDIPSIVPDPRFHVWCSPHIFALKIFLWILMFFCRMFRRQWVPLCVCLCVCEQVLLLWLRMHSSMKHDIMGKTRRSWGGSGGFVVCIAVWERNIEERQKHGDRKKMRKRGALKVKLKGTEQERETLMPKQNMYNPVTTKNVAFVGFCKPWTCIIWT